MKKSRKISSKKGIDLYKSVLLAIIAVLFTAGITSLVYSAYKIVDYREYPIYLEVTHDRGVGFALRSDALSFGKLPLDSTGVLKIRLIHDFSLPLRIVMKISGDAEKFIVITENGFVLEPNTTKTIEIDAVIPANTTAGNYTGKIGVFFKRI